LGGPVGVQDLSDAQEGDRHAHGDDHRSIQPVEVETEDEPRDERGIPEAQRNRRKDEQPGCGSRQDLQEPGIPGLWLFNPRRRGGIRVRFQMGPRSSRWASASADTRAAGRAPHQSRRPRAAG
jgi:hypothetical protein